MEDKVILTAEEILEENGLIVEDMNNKEVWKIVQRSMKEYAKMHVKEALISAYKNGKLTYSYFGDSNQPDYSIIESSILNAYPEKNIK